MSGYSSREEVVWEPPNPSLKKLDANGHTTYFPLELGEKDYKRRILDIVTSGIKDVTIDIAQNGDLKPIPFGQEGNIYFILSTILGGEGWGTTESFAETDRAKRLFSDQLNVDSGKLTRATRRLLDSFSKLADGEKDENRLTGDRTMFDNASELLECFGPSAAIARSNINLLAEQYESHCAFHDSRMKNLGWKWGEGSTSKEESDVPVSSGLDSKRLCDDTFDFSLSANIVSFYLLQCLEKPLNRLIDLPTLRRNHRLRITC